MGWKSPLVALVLPLCLGVACNALGQRTPETVIVIQDTGLDNGVLPPVAVKRGQTLRVYQHMGGRLYVLASASGNPRGGNWGWIEATSALPPDQAATHFSDALQKDPKDATAYLGRAAAELFLGQHDKVIADCDRIVQLDPHSASAFQFRASAWVFKEQPDKAIADLGEVLRLEPDRANALRMRGDLWRKQRNLEKAIADYSRLLRLGPQDCEAYLCRGFCRYEKKEYEQAIADFNEVLSRQPESGSAYQGRGRAWQRLCAYDKAEDDFTESIRLRYQDALRMCRTAWFWAFQGDLRRTIDCFADFQTTYLHRADAYLDRAGCYDARGDREKAFADCSEALWINPHSVRGHHVRGSYWCKTKRFDLAVREFDEALRLGPDDPYACNGVSWFRATCQDAKYRDGKQAVVLGTKACERTNWTYYASIDTLAAAHAEAGNFDEAVRWQKKALDLAPAASKKEMAQRLALYQSHKPYRVPGK